MEVDRVRHYPGGRWLDVEARTLELEVPQEALVAPALVRDVSVEALRSVRTPVPVLAYTVKGKTTQEAIVGAVGALRLARVSPAQ